ncbi:hypothetical protein [Paraliomyxa miuraensis]|uniref:hypothetical protein n=1 Tax=Paraliomyxa miuraensis TaxID=376150 RepID=UPI002250EB79|nr:hypothetical protein [Paraliomyxa miuraensis]MCX4240711.1 hypothetical protein [Paraliomyxa miuraensis]
MTTAVRTSSTCLALVLAVACGPTREPEGGSSGGGSSDGTGDTTLISPTSTTHEGDGSSGSSSAGSSSADSSSTGSDVPDIDCQTVLESDLPGVTIEIDSPCAHSLAQAQDGVETSYTIDVTDALMGVESGQACFETPRGGIHVQWRVFSAEQRHCVCDVGLCPAPTPSPTTLVPGETIDGFEWFAYEWDGPSDTGQPFGDPFVPGDYTIEVVATGFWDDGVDPETPFTIRAQRPVVLVP